MLGTGQFCTPILNHFDCCSFSHTNTSALNVRPVWVLELTAPHDCFLRVAKPADTFVDIHHPVVVDLVARRAAGDPTAEEMLPCESLATLTVVPSYLQRHCTWILSNAGTKVTIDFSMAAGIRSRTKFLLRRCLVSIWPDEPVFSQLVCHCNARAALRFGCPY